MWLREPLLVGNTLREHALRDPQKIALVFEEKRLTFGELNRRVNRLTHTLAYSGIGLGDKVAILAGNCPEYVEVFLANAKIGAVTVPLSPELKEEELCYILNHSDSTILLLGQEFRNRAASLLPRVVKVKTCLLLGEKGTDSKNMLSYEEVLSPASDQEPEVSFSENHPHAIFYTSGSKGFPKGVVRSHRADVLAFLYGSLEFGLRGEDLCLCSAPLHRAGPSLMALMSLYSGATVCLMEAFSPTQALRIIQQEGVTFSFLLPSLLDGMRSLPKDELERFSVSSLRVLISSTIPLSTRTKEWILDYFADIQLYEAYGATELGFCTNLKPQDQRRKMRCVGQPSLGYQVALLDEKGRPTSAGEAGELFVKGPCLFDEYYKDPQTTRNHSRGQWFSVGDIMCCDTEGYYYIVERRPDRQPIGDDELYPSDIHRIIMSHPKVKEAAVFAVPDKAWGESLKALIVLQEGEAAGEEELIAYCQERLSTFQRLGSIELVKDLPRNASDKMLKKAFREKCWQE